MRGGSVPPSGGRRTTFAAAGARAWVRLGREGRGPAPEIGFVWGDSGAVLPRPGSGSFRRMRGRDAPELGSFRQRVPVARRPPGEDRDRSRIVKERGAGARRTRGYHRTGGRGASRVSGGRDSAETL